MTVSAASPPSRSSISFSITSRATDTHFHRSLRTRYVRRINNGYHRSLDHPATAPRVGLAAMPKRYRRSPMARSIWSGTISFGHDRDPGQAVHRGAAQGGVVQPARRPQHGPHPLPEGVGADRRGGPGRSDRQGLRDLQGPLRRDRPRRAGAVHPGCHEDDRPRGVRRPRPDRPGLLREALLPGAAPQPEAVRAARPGAGVVGQGGDRPVRDAQPPVHGGDPGRRTAGW